MELEVIVKEGKSPAHSTPILFVHGYWHAAWCWSEHFLSYFAQHGYTSYALSLRGHGDSEGRNHLRWTSVADYVADVTQVVSQMNTLPVLVGHSLGGLIVQKYLDSSQAPAAVLMASVPPQGVLRWTFRYLIRHPLALLKSTFTMSPIHIINSLKLSQEAFFSENIPEEKLKAYFYQIQDDSYRTYLDMLGLNLPRTKQIENPILVLGAASDNVFTKTEVESTARAYNTKAEIFPDMAHDMMLESGWQAVADRILSWFREIGL
jgi:alpha-beta hydrolase superfamily lysophospholipase